MGDTQQVPPAEAEDEKDWIMELTPLQKAEKVAPKTAESYSYAWDNLMEWIRENGSGDLGDDSLAAHLRHLRAQGLSPKSGQWVMQAVRYRFRLNNMEPYWPMSERVIAEWKALEEKGKMPRKRGRPKKKKG